MKNKFFVLNGRFFASVRNKCLPMFFIYVFLVMSSVCPGCARQSDVIVQNDKEENHAKEEMNDSDMPAGAEKDAGKDKIVVYVCGAVNNAGVYELPDESRICDAVDAAGGLLPDAASESINLATIISDGEQIRVPFNGENVQNPDAVMAEDADNGQSGRINLNTATKEQLMTLSGIGESKADSIISYRETNGKFSDVEQLKEIDGIKDGVYNKIKDSICVK